MPALSSKDSIWFSKCLIHSMTIRYLICFPDQLGKDNELMVMEQPECAVNAAYRLGRTSCASFCGATVQ